MVWQRSSRCSGTARPTLRKGQAEPCDPSDNDWLRKEQVDATHGHFHVYSVSAKSRGGARWNGHALTYKESDRNRQEFGYGISVCADPAKGSGRFIVPLHGLPAPKLRCSDAGAWIGRGMLGCAASTTPPG